MTEAPLAGDAAAIARFRQALDEAGYRLERIRPALLAASRGPRHAALASLIRLFFLRLPVDVADARAALPALGLAAADEMGLIGIDGGRAVGRIEVVPVGDLLFAADGDMGAAEPRPDHVMPPAGSTRLLAHLTPRRPVGTILDLGTGCGYHGILAARHSTRVIATDINPRALAYAEFNAALNGVTTIEFRSGDWLSALADDDPMFDLIVCNPPYVIAPSSNVTFRDDRLADGGSSRALVQQVPDRLNPTGVAVVLVGWTHAADESWTNPLRAWLDDRCDAWLLRQSSVDPPTYAATWNAHLAQDRERYLETIERWVAFYAQRGVQRLAEGAVALRKRATPGAPGVRSADLPPSGLDDSAAQDLALRLEVSLQLEAIDAAAFGRLRLDVAPGHRLDQILRYRDGRFHLAQAALVSETGLHSRFACTALMLRLLAAIDGRRSVEQVLQMAERDRLDSTALGLLREALAHAVLRLT